VAEALNLPLSLGSLDWLLCGPNSCDRVVGHSKVFNRYTIMAEYALEVPLKLWRKKFCMLY
jgi:hypothetical protein